MKKNDADLDELAEELKREAEKLTSEAEKESREPLRAARTRGDGLSSQFAKDLEASLATPRARFRNIAKRAP